MFAKGKSIFTLVLFSLTQLQRNHECTPAKVKVVCDLVEAYNVEVDFESIFRRPRASDAKIKRKHQNKLYRMAEPAADNMQKGDMLPPKPKFTFVEPQKLVKSPMDMVIGCKCRLSFYFNEFEIFRRNGKAARPTLIYSASSTPSALAYAERVSASSARSRQSHSGFSKCLKSWRSLRWRLRRSTSPSASEMWLSKPGTRR